MSGQQMQPIVMCSVRGYGNVRAPKPLASNILRSHRRRRETRALRRIVSTYQRANRKLDSFERREQPTRENVALIVKAWNFAARIHDGEKRDNGEDYLAHCERVALKTAGKGGKSADICNALLHDVIESAGRNGVSKASFYELHARFGPAIARKVALLTKPKWSGSEWVDATHPNYRSLKDRYAKRSKWNGRRWVSPREQEYRQLNGAQLMSKARDEIYYSRMLASGDLRMLAVKFEDTDDNLNTLGFVTGAKRARKLGTTARHLLWLSWRLDFQTFEQQVGSLRQHGLSERQLRKLLEEVKPKPVASPVIVLPPRVLFDARYAEELPSAEVKDFATIYAHPNHLFCRDRLEIEVRIGRDIFEELQREFPELRIRRGKSLLMEGQSGGGNCEFYVIEGFRPKRVGRYIATTGRNKKRLFHIAHGNPPKTTTVSVLRLHEIDLEKKVPEDDWRITLKNYMEFQEKFNAFFVRIRNGDRQN